MFWVILHFLVRTPFGSLAGKRNGKPIDSIEFMVLSLSGLRRRSHCWSKGQTRPEREVRCRSLDPHRNGDHNVPPGHPQCVPFHSSVHHPRCRDDGRECDDRHRSHHEEAQGRHQGSDEPSKSSSSTTSKLTLKIEVTPDVQKFSSSHFKQGFSGELPFLVFSKHLETLLLVCFKGEKNIWESKYDLA